VGLEKVGLEKVGLEKVSGTFSILLGLIFCPVPEKVPDTLIF